MDWNASASPYSALFYDQYGDDFCTANPVACQENLPYFGNLGASLEQLLTAITTGKIGLEVLPSYVDAKNIKIAFNGNFRFQKTLTRLENFLQSLLRQKEKSVAPYVGFLPKGTYKMEGKDAVSNILLTHDDDNLFLQLTVKISTLIPYELREISGLKGNRRSLEYRIQTFLQVALKSSGSSRRSS